MNHWAYASISFYAYFLWYIALDSIYYFEKLATSALFDLTKLFISAFDSLYASFAELFIIFINSTFYNFDCNPYNLVNVYFI